MIEGSVCDFDMMDGIPLAFPPFHDCWAFAGAERSHPYNAFEFCIFKALCFLLLDQFVDLHTGISSV